MNNEKSNKEMSHHCGYLGEQECIERMKKQAPIKINLDIKKFVSYLIRISITQYQQNTNALRLSPPLWQDLIIGPLEDITNEAKILYSTHQFYDNDNGRIIGKVKCKFVKINPSKLSKFDLNSLEIEIFETDHKLKCSTDFVQDILKKYGKMEIHFYKSLTSNLMDNFHITHNSTINAIKNNESIIKTTAITALNLGLLKKGYRIFLHENDKVAELKIGENVFTDKFLREGHNVAKLWIGGAFSTYFDDER